MISWLKWIFIYEYLIFGPSTIKIEEFLLTNVDWSWGKKPPEIVYRHFHFAWQ